MRAFIWTIVVISAIEAGINLIYVIAGKLPAITSFSMGLDIIICFAFIAWGIVLLAGRP